MKKINNITTESAKSIFSVDKVVAGIDELKNYNWPKFTEEDDIDYFVEKIHKILTSKLGPFPNLIRSISQEKIDFPIFRAREVEQVKNNQLFAEFSNPPIPFTTMGRCNFPKHPVFYASNSPLVAMLEVLRTSDFSNQKIYLSSWSIIPNEDNFYFETFLKNGLTKESLYHGFNKDLKQNIDKTFEGLISDEQVLGTIEYLKFLDQQFISDNNYSLSAALAHRRLYVKGNFGSDIIMYPSVQSKGNEVNMAINPNFVMNNMKLNRIYVVSLQNYNLTTKQYSLTFHQYGQVSKNAILWSNDMKDENFKEAVAADFGKFELTEI